MQAVLGIIYLVFFGFIYAWKNVIL